MELEQRPTRAARLAHQTPDWVFGVLALCAAVTVGALCLGFPLGLFAGWVLR